MKLILGGGRKNARRASSNNALQSARKAVFSILCGAVYTLHIHRIDPMAHRHHHRTLPTLKRTWLQLHQGRVTDLLRIPEMNDPRLGSVAFRLAASGAGPEGPTPQQVEWVALLLYVLPGVLERGQAAGVMSEVDQAWFDRMAALLQADALVPWVLSARRLIGGTNTRAAIIRTLKSQLLTDAKLRSLIQGAEATAQALATQAFSQANEQHLRDATQVLMAAIGLEDVLCLPKEATRQSRLDAAVDALKKALAAARDELLPTSMVRTALRFATDSRLPVPVRQQFAARARASGYDYTPANDSPQSTAIKRSAIDEHAYFQAVANHPHEADRTAARLRVALGRADESLELAVFELAAKSTRDQLALDHPGWTTRLAIPMAGDHGRETAHAYSVLYELGGHHNTQIYLASAGDLTGAPQSEAARVARPDPSIAHKVKRVASQSPSSYQVAISRLNALAALGTVVNISIGFPTPALAQAVVRAIQNHPRTIFVLSAGNLGANMSTLARTGRRIHEAITARAAQSGVKPTNPATYKHFWSELINAGTQAAVQKTRGASWKEVHARITQETTSALQAYQKSLIAMYSNVILVGNGDLIGGVDSKAAWDEQWVDVSAPGTMRVQNHAVYRTGQTTSLIKRLTGSSISAPSAAMPMAQAQAWVKMSPEDPGLWPEELAELLRRTVDKDPRFTGMNRSGGVMNSDRLLETAALVGQMRALVLLPAQPSTPQQRTDIEAAHASKVQALGLRLGIQPDRLAEITPLAWEMVHRVHAPQVVGR